LSTKDKAGIAVVIVFICIGISIVTLIFGKVEVPDI
jgi:hypothetical protein